MRFKGKISVSWCVGLVAMNVILCIFNISLGSRKYGWLLLVLWLLLDVYSIPAFFRNYVEVTKKEVRICFGILTRKIPTAEIQALKEIVGVRSAFSASSECIGIISKTIETTYVSVKEPKELSKELIRLNRKIKFFIV